MAAACVPSPFRVGLITCCTHSLRLTALISQGNLNSLSLHPFVTAPCVSHSGVTSSILQTTG